MMSNYPKNLICKICKSEDYNECASWLGITDLSDAEIVYRVENLIFPTLTPREIRLVKLMYAQQMTMRQCSKTMHIAYEHVRHINKTLMGKLRHPTRHILLKVGFEPIKSDGEQMKKPIEVLGLSQRPYNALKREHLLTIGEVYARLNALESIRGLGVKSCAEIREKFEKYTGKAD